MSTAAVPSLDHSLDRRKVLTRGAAAGAALWVAPAVVRVSSAAASASILSPVKNGTADLWKWNSNPPTTASVCSTGPEGNATRGGVQFKVTCSASPTITATITVSSGPELAGDNARDCYILHSNAAGACLGQSAIGRYNSPNGVAVVLGPANVMTGATHFSLVMLQTGGGGTDTYTTTRANITC